MDPAQAGKPASPPVPNQPRTIPGDIPALDQAGVPGPPSRCPLGVLGQRRGTDHRPLSQQFAGTHLLLLARVRLRPPGGKGPFPGRGPGSLPPLRPGGHRAGLVPASPALPLRTGEASPAGDDRSHPTHPPGPGAAREAAGTAHSPVHEGPRRSRSGPRRWAWTWRSGSPAAGWTS